MTSHKIVISHDGMWPTRWRWEATALIRDVPEGETPRYDDTHTMRGEALTKERAQRQAWRAIQTMKVLRP
jgi:hypothetical protein